MHENTKKIIDALSADPETLIQWATVQLIALGAKSEWDSDDNYDTTEGLAGLAVKFGLPSAGSQNDEALRFYGEAALSLGLDADIAEEDDDDED